jgi:nicotinate-nucleotide pyrophosphorylase (carboxylating)
VEVFDAEEAVRAAVAGADMVLLDNFSPEQVAAAVGKVRARFGPDRVELEASGGIALGNVRAYALAGVERISIGALTHSAPALDLSLKFSGAGID